MDTEVTYLRTTPLGELQYEDPKGKVIRHQLKVLPNELRAKGIPDKGVQVKIIDHTISVTPLVKIEFPLVIDTRQLDPVQAAKWLILPQIAENEGASIRQAEQALYFPPGSNIPSTAKIEIDPGAALTLASSIPISGDFDTELLVARVSTNSLARALLPLTPPKSKYLTPVAALALQYAEANQYAKVNFSPKKARVLASLTSRWEEATVQSNRLGAAAALELLLGLMNSDTCGTSCVAKILTKTSPLARELLQQISQSAPPQIDTEYQKTNTKLRGFPGCRELYLRLGYTESLCNRRTPSGSGSSERYPGDRGFARCGNSAYSSGSS